MKNLVNSFLAHVAESAERPAHDVMVFITDIVLPHKDKVVLKHLHNSGVDVMALTDMVEARTLYADLETNCKLVTSQEGVNIRYDRWYPSVRSESTKDYGPTEDPSVGPDAIYNESVVAKIASIILPWCRGRKFQSFVSYGMMDWAVSHAIYGNGENKPLELDDQQKAVVRFVTDRFTSRYCVISPFNDKGWNLGSEMMGKMFPQGVKYRAQKYTRGNKSGEVVYFIVVGDEIINRKSGKKAIIPESTFGERSPLRLKIDTELYYSACV